MTNSPTSNEREERLAGIRNRFGTSPATWEDIGFLLSLLDSQAASNTSSLLRRLKDFLFYNCDHAERDRNYDWCPSCVMAFMEVTTQPSNCEAATAMRTACVEKVRAMRDKWIERENAHLDSHGDCHAAVDFNKQVSAANKIITALESLQVEQSNNEPER